ncbi:MAG: hypothetical protein COB59_09025 [Rhodospirillaceae bacterium]|nr:MAG: hypothetical protein COB59_09025 [Rhodospirillaceae bacterium]
MPFPSFAQVPPGSPEERLFQAVWAGDMAKVQASLDEGANILAENSRRKTAVDLAADRGYYNIVHYLMQRLDQLKRPPAPLFEVPPTQFREMASSIVTNAPPPEPQIQVTGPDPFAPMAAVQSGLSPASAPAGVVPLPQAKAKIVMVVPPIKKITLEPKAKAKLKLAPPTIVRYEPAPVVGVPAPAKPRALTAPVKTMQRKDLSDALTVILGKKPPAAEPKKAGSCLKKGKTRIICIEKTTWSEGLFNHYSSLDVSIYKRFGSGGRAVVGYVGGTSTFIKTIFAVADYDSVVEHFSKRYGKADNRQKKIVAPLGKPQMENLVLSWYGLDPATQRETVLQIIHYDTTQNRFAKMTEGAIIYKYLNERSVFAFVNPIELVRLP